MPAPGALEELDGSAGTAWVRHPHGAALLGNLSFPAGLTIHPARPCKDPAAVTRPASYTTTAIALHWVIALLIFFAWPLGVYMHDLPLSPQKLQYYAWHKWAGVTVFLLAVVRLAWRANHPAPALPASMPGWQQRMASGLHHLLYLLILAIPVTGWLMSSAKGFQTVWFGVLPLPDLVAKDKALGDLLAAVHKILNFGLLALVLAHVAASVKHHLIDRDDILTRMLPFLKRA
jgi:cytochrome b561